MAVLRAEPGLLGARCDGGEEEEGERVAATCSPADARAPAPPLVVEEARGVVTASSSPPAASLWGRCAGGLRGGGADAWEEAASMAMITRQLVPSLIFIGCEIV